MVQGLAKSEVIKQFAIKKDDSGSPEVQVALLTQKILNLSEHMKNNKHDFTSKRGLLIMVARRRKLLDYLKRSNVKRYTTLISALGIRK